MWPLHCFAYGLNDKVPLLKLCIKNLKKNEWRNFAHVSKLHTSNKSYSGQFLLEKCLSPRSIQLWLIELTIFDHCLWDSDHAPLKFQNEDYPCQLVNKVLNTVELNLSNHLEMYIYRVNKCHDLQVHPMSVSTTIKHARSKCQVLKSLVTIYRWKYGTQRI